MTYDLIIRQGTLCLPTGETVGDLAIEDGVIAAIAGTVEERADSEIRAEGLHVFPGCIDVHVHLDDPGRADWEGVDTGTQALAAGGVTTFCDMPLNSIPPTIDGQAYDAKYAAYRGQSWIDYAFWGGLVPGGTDLEALRERGAIGVKAFMATSNTPEFPRVDDLTLLDGMEQCAKLGMIVAVHAENDEMTDELTARARASGRRGAADFVASRPAVAEVEAITRAIVMARETSCSLHIVHVSSRSGLEVVLDARRDGVDVTCETCPHYLVFGAHDLARIGVAAKCQPPLRNPVDQAALWQFLSDQPGALVASDHSPAPAAMRVEGDFLGSWGGIAGAQTTLITLLTSWSTGDLGPSHAARVFSANPARRFGLADRGRLEVGYRGDVAVCRLGVEHEFLPERSRSRDKSSPFIGMTFHAEVVHTVVAGRVVWSEGSMVGEPSGQLVRSRRGQT